MIMIRLILPVLAVLCLSFPASAQQIRPADAGTIYHELAELNRLTRVLYLAAHPDDENTRLLAWMVHRQHIPTAYLSLTRGDGGQNILGSEQGAALGLIRTYELLEARKMDGADQFFTRAIDFGFSKNTTETFRHWHEDRLTGDVVWVIRNYRPDLIICRFPPTTAAGHGHHAASAVIGEKAFEAAGNRKRYPEQLAQVQPWQPRRIIFNAYRFGSGNTITEQQMKLQVGQYDPLLGMSYGELAGKSRSIHRSQGAGTPGTAGVQTEYFQLVAGDVMQDSLFEGIDISWNRAGRPDIGRMIDTLMLRFDFRYPELSLPGLLRLRGAIRTVQDTVWRDDKLAALDRVILHASGLLAECVTENEEAVPGSRLSFNLNLVARGGKTPIAVTSIQWPGTDTACALNLPPDSMITLSRTVLIPRHTPVTEPYWLAGPATDPAHYSLPADSLLGLPETPAVLFTDMALQIGTEAFLVRIPLSSKKLDPLKGDVVLPLRIVPDVSVSLTSDLLIARADGALQVPVRIRCFRSFAGATLTLLSGGQKLTEIRDLHLEAGADTVLQIPLSTSQTGIAGKEDYTLNAVLSTGDGNFSRQQHLIRYDHLPPLQYFTPAAAKVIRNTWKCTAKRIGYIEGAGDYVAGLLRETGIQVDMLRESDLADVSRLKGYDAIVTGVRAANTEKRMAVWIPVLLRYVENGGTLIMQYNNARNLTAKDLGPYPFTLSNLRVTEEDAPVTFTDAHHRLLQTPNRITEADFRGWVQERGLNFASEWDNRYQTPFSMHDTGEDPQRGGTLYTPYGKGHYVYTSLSFFRQLPAGNKGAIRLFMNMLSLRK